MKNFNIIFVLFVLFICESTYADKEIEVQDFKFSVPDDTQKVVQNLNDYTMYHLVSNNNVLLSIFLGNNPNRDLFSKPKDYEKFTIDAYPDIEVPYWVCDIKKQSFCSQVEINFPNIDFPSYIQLSYNQIPLAASKVANKTIRTMRGPTKLSANIFHTNEKPDSFSFCPWFKINLPKNTFVNKVFINKKYGAYRDANFAFVVFDQSYFDETKPHRFDPIKFSISEKTDFLDYENSNFGRKINNTPFFYRLKNNFADSKVLFIDVSEGQPKAEYRIIVNIPFSFNKKNISLNILANISENDDANQILNIINSIQKQETSLPSQECLDSIK